MLKLRKVEMKPGSFIFQIDCQCFNFDHMKAKCKMKQNCTNLEEPIDNSAIMLVLLKACCMLSNNSRYSKALATVQVITPR